MMLVTNMNQLENTQKHIEANIYLELVCYYLDMMNAGIVLHEWCVMNEHESTRKKQRET